MKWIKFCYDYRDDFGFEREEEYLIYTTKFKTERVIFNPWDGICPCCEPDNPRPFQVVGSNKDYAHEDILYYLPFPEFPDWDPRGGR